MATFIKGISDQLGPMQLYRPDYQFLTQVYGTKQAQYDRGFNMVKNLYNSVLNGELTNAGNQNFRQEAFKKIQASLKSMANVDLSNPTNVMRASSLVDPISKDTDIAYDMYVTKFHNKQKQLMENYKNSTDPKMRAMYNEYSRMDIAFAEEDLRNAKRGDGSIMKVQPREFVPFEDINEYLREAAKKDGLEIKRSTPLGNGYILETKNGVGTISIYDNWATTVMGNRFDRQLGVIGRVNAESAIRNEMATKNISREQAVMNVAERIVPELNIQQSTAGITAQKQLKKVEDEINHFERSYPNGFPASKPEIEQEYNKLVKARDEFKVLYENAQNEVGKLQQEGAQYVASNLYSIYSQAAKRQASLQFASAHATKNQSEIYRPDTTWATKANIASREKVAFANLSQRQKELDWDKQKTAMTNELKMIELQGKGYVSNEQYVSAGMSDVPVYASDLNDAALKQNREEVYISAFNGGNGLMKLVVNESASDYSRFYGAISKVKQIADGKQIKLEKQDIDNLNEYAEEKLGIRIATPNNAATARAVIDALGSRTYLAASEKLKQYGKTHTKTATAKYLESFNRAAGNFQDITAKREQLNEDMKRISQEVIGPDGSIKELYKGAVVRGRLANGAYDVDVTNVSEAAKQRLSGLVKGFKDQQNPSSFTYDFSKLTPAELTALIKNPYTANSITTSEGSTLDLNVLKNLNTADLADLFGDRASVFYDAAKRQVRVELNVSQKEGIGKTLGMKGAQSLYVNIPYETIQSSQGALWRMAKYIPINSVNTNSLGIFAPFVANPDATVRGESYKANLGFDYTIQGVQMQDGSRKLMLTYDVFNPENGKRMEGKPEYYDFTPGDPKSLLAASAAVNQAFQNYMTSTGIYESNLKK